jgi:hypothetical protein
VRSIYQGKKILFAPDGSRELPGQPVLPGFATFIQEKNHTSQKASSTERSLCRAAVLGLLFALDDLLRGAGSVGGLQGLVGTR